MGPLRYNSSQERKGHLGVVICLRRRLMNLAVCSVSPEFDVYENLIGMDICNIPFPDNSFNTVVSTEVLFYGMDRSQALKELTRGWLPEERWQFQSSQRDISIPRSSNT